MDGNEILLLGLGIQSPWKLMNQHLDTSKQPHELHLEVKAERGSKYACPECGQLCKAHDFQEKTWRHLNFFQHHCYIHASVPRVKCSEHGVKLIDVPWARKGSAFTLLFEQAALTLVREMPVNAAARIIEITDKRLWRIVDHYVGQAIEQFDLSDVKAVGLDETASKRGHNYVTVFIDMERRKEPVLFVTSGKGKQTVAEFSDFLKTHKGEPSVIQEAVCDMSPAFLTGIKESLPQAEVTVDWFHIVQTFTRALDEVRKREGRVKPLPKHLRWSVLKRGDADHLTTNQLKALAELLDQGLDTATAWRIKERLDWIRLAKTPRAARWRITRFIGYAREIIGDSELLEPVRKALATLENHAERVVRRWTSTYTNARMEGLNSLFQAARARARGYRNNRTLYNYDLHDCQPGGFHTEIHMKRRRAGTEEQCYSALFHLRWPDGFVCPECGNKTYCKIKSRKVYQCHRCHRQTSLTSGTIFAATKVPLTKWFLAIYLLTQRKTSVSALQLKRDIGVSYNTAWKMKHKLMQVMLEREKGKKLSGRIEIDDAYIGGERPGKPGRGAAHKAPFIAVVETEGEEHRPQRMQLRTVSGFRSAEIERYAKTSLEVGSIVVSDGLACFKAVEKAGCHPIPFVSEGGRKGVEHPSFKWVNTMLGNVKNAITGTFHSVSLKHVPRYLAEFEYRFNRRYRLDDMIASVSSTS